MLLYGLVLFIHFRKLTDIDGIGGATLPFLHKGIEMQGMTLPLLRNQCTDKTDRAGYWGNKSAFVLVGTEDEQMELVVLVIRSAITVESNANHTFLIHFGRGDTETRHRTPADTNAGIVDAVSTIAVLVELLENAMGIELIAYGFAVKPHRVSHLHGRRQPRNLSKGIAMCLLRLGLRICHRLRHLSLIRSAVP